MAKSTRKREFHLCVVFPTRAPCSEKSGMPNMNFAFCSNNKYELGDVYNYLIIFTLGKKLPWKWLYVLSALIPTETVENNPAHLVANKVGSIMFSV